MDDLVVLFDVDKRKVFDAYNAYKGNKHNIVLYTTKVLRFHSLLERAYNREIKYCREDVILQTIAKLSETYKKKRVIIFPTEEHTIKLIEQQDNFAHDLTTFDYEKVKTFEDKFEFYKYCTRMGYSVAQTQIASSYDISKLSPETKKLIAKPRIGAGMVGHVVVESNNTEIDFRSSDYADFIVQEFLDIEKVYGYFCFRNSSGFTKDFCHERVITHTSVGGVSLVAVSKLEPKVLSLGRKFVSESDFVGLIMLEIAQLRNGNWVFIEANPRLWGSNLLTLSTGVDVINSYHNVVCNTAIDKSDDFEESEIWWLFGILIRPSSWLRVIRHLLFRKRRQVLLINIHGTDLIRSVSFNFFLAITRFLQRND